LDTRHTRAGELPDLLTVEEAADILRLGRTKAYAMARQWRVTGGQAGLPVLDFGNVLRVPRHALERLIGAELSAPVSAQDSEPEQLDTDRQPTSRRRLGRRPKSKPASQLDLFDPSPAG
jgi:hypothetical protein